MPVLVEPLNTNLQLNSNEDLFLKSWQITDIDPPHNGHDGDQMPVISPLYPEQNTAYNVNLFTRKLITKIMKEAYNLLENEENNNYLKLFDNFDYKKYYDYFILITCLETKIQINNNCISVKARLRITLLNWAKSDKINALLGQYHVVSSFQRKEENCLIDGLYGSCTVWIVGIKLIDSTNTDYTKLSNTMIDMLEHYTKFLNKGSLNVKSFLADQSEIEQKILSFINDKYNNLTNHSNLNKIEVNYQNKHQYKSQPYFGPSQNLRKENPLDHNKLILPNICDNDLNDNFVFLPKQMDLVIYFNFC
uniref:PAP_central domain-containing protein n=1 Tax=Meloidogyne hapla TaxID=6305 RepID=A0A1I8BEG8_MELHA